jgi:hypothetical protein
MNYAKPEVNLFSEAVSAILGSKSHNTIPDAATAGGPVSGYKLTVNAYEADE